MSNGSVDPAAVRQSALFLSSEAKLFEGDLAVEGKSAIIDHHVNMIREFERPDIAIGHVFVDGAKASLHWELRDRSIAAPSADPTSGRTVRIYGSTLICFQEMKIAEIRHYTDRSTDVSP